MEKKQIRKREKKKREKKGRRERERKSAKNRSQPLRSSVLRNRRTAVSIRLVFHRDARRSGAATRTLSLSLSFLERISPKLLSHCYVNTRVAVRCTRLARIEMEMEKRGSGGHGGGALGTHGRSVEREKAIDPLDRRERNLGRWKKLGRDFFQDSKGQAGEL